jgi:hypothetical protein
VIRNQRRRALSSSASAVAVERANPPMIAELVEGPVERHRPQFELALGEL